MTPSGTEWAEESAGDLAVGKEDVMVCVWGVGLAKVKAQDSEHEWDETWGDE